MNQRIKKYADIQPATEEQVIKLIDALLMALDGEQDRVNDLARLIAGIACQKGRAAAKEMANAALGHIFTWSDAYENRYAEYLAEDLGCATISETEVPVDG